jgi:hypothetical protein
VSEDPGAADGDVADGSDRSLPAPDVSAREWTRTRTSDATEPPPPVDVAVAEAVRVQAASSTTTAAPPAAPAAAPAVSYDGAPRAAVRTAGQPGRLPLVVQGLVAAAVAGPLAGGAVVGAPVLLVAVLALQVASVLAVLAVLGAPAAAGAAVVAVGAAVAADAVLVLDEGDVDRVAGVVGLSLVVALLHQLLRRSRNRVTESLADTMLAVVVVAAASCLVALASSDSGRDVLLPALATAATVLLVGRLGDRVLPRPVLAAGATRGWPGLLLGGAAGVAAAVLTGEAAAVDFPPAAAALLGLAVAVTVATADLAVDLGAAELRPGRRDARRVAASRLAAALLPYALLGPVVLLAAQLVLS